MSLVAFFSLCLQVPFEALMPARQPVDHCVGGRRVSGERVCCSHDWMAGLRRQYVVVGVSLLAAEECREAPAVFCQGGQQKVSWRREVRR